MKICDKQYMIDEYGYGETKYNLIINIASDDDECCYCCDIDDKNNLHLFGAKFEIRNGTDIVSFDTVIDMLQLNDDESMILKNIILCNGDIERIKSICINTHTLFNDEYITINMNSLRDMLNARIKKSKYFSNFDFVLPKFEKLNDKVIALLVVDENNELNQYRCCIDTMLNVSIQYVDKSTDDVVDLISFKINEYDITNNLNVILNEMFIHLYIYMYVEHFSIDD